MIPTKQDLLDQKAQLVAYLQSKLKASDWHAVQDAASDIRELVAKLEVLDELHAATQSAIAVHVGSNGQHADA